MPVLLINDRTEIELLEYVDARSAVAAAKIMIASGLSLYYNVVDAVPRIEERGLLGGEDRTYNRLFFVADGHAKAVSGNIHIFVADETLSGSSYSY